VERTLIPSKQREVEVFVRARLAPEKEVKRLITASFGRGSRCGRRSSPGSLPVSPAVVELADPASVAFSFSRNSHVQGTPTAGA
jgi:hypothetical protein